MNFDIFAQQLKIERLRRGWTLKQVSDLTLISITVLKFIEAKKFEEIGEERTVEVLLRRYSDALGERTSFSQPFAEGNNGKIDASLDLRKSKSNTHSSLFLIGLVLTLTVGLGVLYHNYKALCGCSDKPIAGTGTENLTDESKVSGNFIPPKAEDRSKTPQGEERVPAGVAGSENQASEPKTVSTENGAPYSGQPDSLSASERAEIAPEKRPGPAAVASSPNMEPDPASHQLEIQAAQRTWIQVAIDGASPASELLLSDERRTWKAFNKIDLVIGNQGDVRLKWDGRPLELGKTDHAIRISLSDSGIEFR